MIGGRAVMSFGGEGDLRAASSTLGRTIGPTPALVTARGLLSVALWQLLAARVAGRWPDVFVRAIPLTAEERSEMFIRALESGDGGPSGAEHDRDLDANRDALAVFADSLQEAGDPLGEWLALWLSHAPCSSCHGSILSANPEIGCQRCRPDRTSLPDPLDMHGACDEFGGEDAY